MEIYIPEVEEMIETKSCRVGCELTNDVSKANIVLCSIDNKACKQHFNDPRLKDYTFSLFYTESTLEWSKAQSWGENHQTGDPKTDGRLKMYYIEEMGRYRNPNEMYLSHFDPYTDSSWIYRYEFEEIEADKEKNKKEMEEMIRTEKDSEFLAVTFVGKCRYPRTKYINEIEKYFKILNIGACKDFRHQKVEKYKNIKDKYSSKSTTSRRYKFIICFENSMRYNYVTEKLFHGLQSHAIPVYYGSPKVKSTLKQILKNFDKVYLDTRDFRSPKELADYMLYLDKNETAYLEYFEWKNYFKVKHYRTYSTILCDMCELYKFGNKICGMRLGKMWEFYEQYLN